MQSPESAKPTKVAMHVYNETLKVKLDIAIVLSLFPSVNKHLACEKR